MPALEAEYLSRIVAGKVLVNNISVQVQVGEVLAIVGPSGSGKTSFLRLLNRLDEPTSGIIRFNGQDYRELAPQKLRQRIGMVMQAAYLFPGTVADNVAYGPLQRGQTLPAEQIATLLQRVDLPGYQERGVSNLSGGEAQRVSIARTSRTIRKSFFWMSQPRHSTKIQRERSRTSYWISFANAG